MSWSLPSSVAEPSSPLSVSSLLPPISTSTSVRMVSPDNPDGLSSWPGTPSFGAPSIDAITDSVRFA